MSTIEEFCDFHQACDEGRKWALSECQTMQEVWNRAKPEWLVWVATRKGVFDDRTLRLFACWCVRQVWHLLDDDRSKNAVIVAERHAGGLATDGELTAAWAAAWAAARAAARDAVRYAACEAAWDAVRYAAWAAARDAAWAAAWDAVRYAACEAAWEAACEAAREAQAAWLRENAKPCFEKGGEG